MRYSRSLLARQDTHDRRYTNFSLEPVEQTWNGTPGWGKKTSCTISRNGDLVAQCWLEISLKKGTAAATIAPFSAEAFIREVTVEIGGQKIDTMYSTLNRIKDELFRNDAEKAAYKDLVSFQDGDPIGTVRTFYLPLNFWFCKSPGMALPLIALKTAAHQSIGHLHAPMLVGAY